MDRLGEVARWCRHIAGQNSFLDTVRNPSFFSLRIGDVQVSQDSPCRRSGPSTPSCLDQCHQCQCFCFFPDWESISKDKSGYQKTIFWILDFWIQCFEFQKSEFWLKSSLVHLRQPSLRMDFRQSLVARINNMAISEHQAFELEKRWSFSPKIIVSHNATKTCLLWKAVSLVGFIRYSYCF